jgi:uncharacterized phage-associated protein
VIRFSFDERKAAQAAAHLIARKGGQMNYMLLIKLMYMADRASLLRRRQTITGDDLYAMTHGPALSRVLNLIRHGKADSSPWFDYIGEKNLDYTVSLRMSATGELSDSELAILDEVFDEYGHWNPFKLRDHLHEILPEWDDPMGTSVHVDPETILRLENRGQAEIDIVAAKAREDRFFEQL